MTEIRRRIETVNGTRVPHEATVPALASSIRRPGPEVWAAFAALAGKGCCESWRVLREAAEDPDWRIRRSAVEALGWHRLAADAASVLLRALADPRPEVVRTACAAAVDGRIVEAHDALRDLLRDCDPKTRKAAVSAIRELWRPEDFEAVCRVHESDPATDVRREAAWTLFSNPAPDTWRKMFDCWVGDPLHRHRLWACQLAQTFGGRAVMPTLRRLTADPNGHVRTAARTALSALESP
jgi:HEAT repeat protein